MRFKLVALPDGKERWTVLAQFQAPDIDRAVIICNALANNNTHAERYCLEWKDPEDDHYMYGRWSGMCLSIMWDHGE